jgi:hypothetical protein
LITSCEYDVAEPQWDKEYTLAPSPVISGVEPAGEAAPGVNTITIRGERFIGIPVNNGVYFEIPETTTVLAEILEMTPTSITVRRPNLVTQSANIKINSDSGGVVVKFGPYKIDPVITPFGSFVEYGVALGGIDIDNSGNIFVAKGGTAPFIIYKVTADGQKTNLADSLPRPDISSPPSGAPIGVTLSNDYLYLFRAHRHIQRVNTVTGIVTSYHHLKTNRQLRVGTFDSNGYLYAGGNKVGLWVIAPDSTSEERTDLYQTNADTMWAMHVYNNYLYIALGSADGHAIVRHSIGSAGSLGPKEQVLNVGQFTTSIINDFAIASDGKIYLSIDGDDSFIVYDPAATSFDYFYKDITPPYCKQFGWGAGNYIYMISGNITPAQNWTVYQVDMGITSAP